MRIPKGRRGIGTNKTGGRSWTWWAWIGKPWRGDLQVVGEYDWVLIDGAPQIAKLSAVAVKVADLVLIPVQPSPFDVLACADLVEMVDARREVTGGKPLAYFVVSRAIKNTKLSGEVGAALEDYGLPVFKSGTTQRVLYPTTASEGTTVLATFPDEIEAIKDELKEVLTHAEI